MMKFEDNILKESVMSFTGSKLLNIMQDNSTPFVDLLVRESIQNSTDAILQNKEYGVVEFTIETFDNNHLINTLPQAITERMKNVLKEDNYSFIAIADKNTTGLMGPAHKTDKGPNNLYSLVYNVMNNSKEDSHSGGSWGIGKTIYFRNAEGICFFYSRTFENNKYCSKLVGTLVQDETKASCFLGPKTAGIAFFGKYEDDRVNRGVNPVSNEKEIEEFLSIFGIDPYKNDETGTIVIIPYLKEEKLLVSNNDNEGVARAWMDNSASCLKMAIQRWYFPRLNNRKYKEFTGKQYLRVFVNKSPIRLNTFFQALQNLYNGDLEGCKTEEIIKDIDKVNQLFGWFNYKVFSSEELDINVPPNNNPSPKYFVDSKIDCDREGLLFYVRKPGMISNYGNNEFGEFSMDEGQYLIGIFRLNDDLQINNEELGQYMRKSEKANHEHWDDITGDNDFPTLIKAKPFKKISKVIKKVLRDKFDNRKSITFDEENAITLQRELGRILMPPFDFGDGPTVPTKKGSGGNGENNGEKGKNRRKEIVEFKKDHEANGNLKCSITVTILPKENYRFEIEVKVGIKSYKFENWEKDFESFPFMIDKITVDRSYFLDGKFGVLDKDYSIPINGNFPKRQALQLKNKEKLFSITGLSINSHKAIPYGFIIGNPREEKILLTINIEIKPIDFKYSIGHSSSFEKGGNDE